MYQNRYNERFPERYRDRLSDRSQKRYQVRYMDKYYDKFQDRNQKSYTGRYWTFDIYLNHGLFKFSYLFVYFQFIQIHFVFMYKLVCKFMLPFYIYLYKHTLFNK